MSRSNKDEMQYRISTMQSAVDGKKQVEQRSRKSGTAWIPVVTPSWNWDKNEYRIAEPLAKPNPITLPQLLQAHEYPSTIINLGLGEHRRIVMDRRIRAALEAALLQPGDYMTFRLVPTSLKAAAAQKELFESFNNYEDFA